MTKYIIEVTTPQGIKYITEKTITPVAEKDNARLFNSKSEAKRFIAKNKRNITASHYEVMEV